MSFELRITNAKNGLSKLINVEKYTFGELINTLIFYIKAGFDIKIIRGVKFAK